MNNKSFTTLEFDKVKHIIADYAISRRAKDIIIGLTPYDNIADINFALSETGDAIQCIEKIGLVPIRGIGDLSAITKRLDMGGVLSIAELLQISNLLRATATAAAYSHEAKDWIGQLTIGSYFAGLDPLVQLNREIERCIVGEDEIADHASHELSKIRNTIGHTQAKIKNQLNKIIQSASQSGYLQDSLITIRNDRYCLPIKAEYKNQFKGLIHDHSTTGSTAFIEPLVIVELNNAINDLRILEKKEIHRILALLSSLAAEKTEQLVENEQLLIELDFLFAKANYAMETRCSRPNFNQHYVIRLEKARHPLLNPDTVVPITIYLGEHFSSLIITGPNTGGKTVTLKTIGLLSLMGQSGLYIPAADGAKLTLLDNIFADIGDEQSIEQSLSTFSSHMTNITAILDKVTDKSLVLFDELGAGTDPVEGAALAISILETLKEANILTVATTHYSELKVYALSTDGVENAGCEFDVDTLRPTYKLLIGIPGKSNAFSISKRLGLSDYIINRAKEFLSSKAIKFEDILSDLEASRKKADLEKEKTEAYRREAQQLQQQLEQQQKQLIGRKQAIIEEARRDAARILDSAKDEADTIIRSMNQLAQSGTKVDMAELERQRASIRDRLKETQTTAKASSSTGPDISQLAIGDMVYVISLDQKGSIVDLNRSRQTAQVQIGIIKTSVAIKDLRPAEDFAPIHYQQAPIATGKKWQPAKGNRQKSATSFVKTSSASTEIDVRGTDSIEAVEQLNKFLDNAYLGHLSQVTIIHGKGTGKLRQTIHDHLRNLQNSNTIKDFRSGEYGEGGNGVTIVQF